MCELLTKINRAGYYIDKRVKDGVSLTTINGAMTIQINYPMKKSN